MSKYKQLTREDRIEIASLIKSNRFNQTQIALQIGKNKSSISRELSRNKGLTKDSLGTDNYNYNYNYSIAHNLAKNRKTKANQLRTKIVFY